jgi:hypothetical protein
MNTTEARSSKLSGPEAEKSAHNKQGFCDHPVLIHVERKEERV